MRAPSTRWIIAGLAGAMVAAIALDAAGVDEATRIVLSATLITTGLIICLRHHL